MFNTIVLATDLSPASNALVECAVGLKTLGVERVILTYAMRTRHLHDRGYLIASKVRPFLLEQQKTIREQGLAVDIKLAPGNLADEIQQVAEQHYASLVVIAAHGETMAEHSLFNFGDTVAEVLHSCTRPLLLVKTKITRKGMDTRAEGSCLDYLDNILYCTDFSDTAQRAYDYVEKLVAEGCKNVTIMHVQDKTRIDQQLAHELEEFNRIDAARIEVLKERLAQKGATTIQIKLPYGIPTAEILDEVTTGTYSLVVMGSQGKGYIRELFLGSVSYSIARYAATSVLLIPTVR